MFKYILILFLFSQQIYATVGQEIGNGGGFARCADGKYYSYDYILSAKSSFGSIQTGLNLNQRLQQISKNLHRLNEPLVKEFDEYMYLLFQQIPKSKFQWLPQQNLQMVWDPDLDRQLPLQCKTRKQAVVFMSGGAQLPYVGYYFDPVIIQQVRSQPEGDLQVSFLSVHEWLWNYFLRPNFLKLAYFNRLLHSDKLGSMTQQEYLELRKEFLR